MSTKSPFHLDKRLARLAAVQALYQQSQLSIPIEDISKEFKANKFQMILDEAPVDAVDVDLFHQLVTGVAHSPQELDTLIEQNLASGWTMGRLEKVALFIIRAGVYELLKTLETPAVIIVSEYADIAHAFFDLKDAAFVNGLLNKVARIIRQQEFPNEETNRISLD